MVFNDSDHREEAVGEVGLSQIGFAANRHRARATSPPFLDWTDGQLKAFLFVEIGWLRSFWKECLDIKRLPRTDFSEQPDQWLLTTVSDEIPLLFG
jgi:hypothetical protein